MTTDTNNTNGTNGIDPQMNRRQMMKTVGAAGGVATVGSGMAGPSDLSMSRDAKALPDIAEALGPTTAFGGLQMVKNWLGGTDGVDETANTKSWSRRKVL